MKKKVYNMNATYSTLSNKRGAGVGKIEILISGGEGDKRGGINPNRNYSKRGGVEVVTFNLSFVSKPKG